jgi:hypothetical protein
MELQKRWAAAKEFRAEKEAVWEENERYYYEIAAANGQAVNLSTEDLEALGVDTDESELSLRDVAINYVSRDIRYMHAMMSANPPTVKIVPLGVDIENEERADAADITARWAREHYTLDEVSDQRNLKTLTKGTGYIITRWDSTLGDILEYDDASGALTMTGDCRIYSPSTWNIWLDPDARSANAYLPDGVKWFFEEIPMSLEEAVMRWPDYEKELKATSGGAVTSRFRSFFTSKETAKRGLDKVKILCYRERAEAVNGMKGRHAYWLENGCVLDFGANDNPNAVLGLDILTDIDVEDDPYGKSIIEYIGPIQQMIQNLDANTLRNVAAHATIRMYVDGNTTLSDDALSNDALDIIQGDGAPPMFLNPPSQMVDAWKLRDQLHQGRSDVSMINEAMLGQASRETSGYTTQLQVNQGNMGRRRLFNKFTASTKNVYYMLLGLLIDNWDEPRKVQVLGTERSYEVYEFDKTDLDGGWDIMAAYGQNFSLDPNTARDQIMQLMPLFEKIDGFDYRTLVDAIRLNVMDNFVDHLAVAKRRQREIFKKMIRDFLVSGASAYIKPRKNEDHKNMLKYCAEFTMTREYDLLDNDLKKLVDAHIDERTKMAADQIAAAQAPAPAGAAPGTNPLAAMMGAAQPPQPAAV